MPSATTVRSRPRPNHLRLVTDRERPPRPAARSDGGADRSVLTLLFATAALMVLGLVMVLSASSVSAYAEYGSSFLFFKRQLAYAAVGSVALWVATRIPYEAWRRLCVPVLLASVVLLGLVLHPAFGTVAGGSARWIEVGPVNIQPSELAKLAVVSFSAALLARRWRRLDDARSLAMPLLPVVVLVCGLILFQPDMGTAVIVLGSVFLVAFVAGARLKHLAFGALASTALGFALTFAAGYRWSRFLCFLDPWADREGCGYQLIQSLLGLSTGGPLGLGLGAGRQKWSYVPNAHTDFIYSIVGEELGLVGAIGVLLLFGLFIFSGIRIAVRAPDAFGRLLAAGITGWLGIQALTNLGAVTGLLPITGVPLPFVSFGGSSLVVSMVGVGILVSVGRASGERAARAASPR